MTPAQLAVERDALLQGGRTLEEVERMQVLLEHPTTVADAQLLAQCAGWMLRLRPGEQCPSCRRIGDYRILHGHQHNSRCDLVLAARRLAALSPPESASGASAHRPGGETP